MDHAYITTPHHTTPDLPSAASRHECSLPHACTRIMASAHAHRLMFVVLQSCAHCAVMQALTSRVPCLCSIFSVDAVCNTSVLYSLVLHIVVCPRQLSFVLQMAAAWSIGAVA